jgi:hypothetical protein
LLAFAVSLRTVYNKALALVRKLRSGGSSLDLVRFVNILWLFSRTAYA